LSRRKTKHRWFDFSKGAEAMKKLDGASALVALTLATVLCIGISRAQQDQGPGEKAGEKLDQAGRSIRRGLEQAGDTIREQFAKTRESINNMGVASRVYGRLHWDKLLTSSTLDLDVKDGIATLRGSVPSAKAKARALDLTRETVGVTRVIDQLAVQPPPQNVPATSSDPTTKS
jgi:hyperosmotically inducible periplasmic protein